MIIEPSLTLEDRWEAIEWTMLVVAFQITTCRRVFSHLWSFLVSWKERATPIVYFWRCYHVIWLMCSSYRAKSLWSPDRTLTRRIWSYPHPTTVWSSNLYTPRHGYNFTSLGAQMCTNATWVPFIFFSVEQKISIASWESRDVASRLTWSEASNN